MKFNHIVLSSLIGAGLGLSGAAQAAQGVSLASGFTDFTTWTLFGTATANNFTPGNGFHYSDLNLTQLTSPGTGGQFGSGFAPTTVSLDFNQAFSFDFHFFIPTFVDPSLNGLRGDGLTFTLAGAPGLGGGGSGLGYEGIGSNSVAFAIDTFNFQGEPVSPSVQILAGGSVTPLAATETGLGDAIRDPNFQWYAHVDYTPSGLNDNAGSLMGTIEHFNLGNFSVSANVDFAALGMVGNPVFYGFTAGNGLATDGHVVTSAVPVPEPESWALLLAGLGVVGWLLRRRG